MSYSWEIHYSLVAIERRYLGRFLLFRYMPLERSQQGWLRWKLHYLFMLKSAKLSLRNLIKLFYIHSIFISCHVLPSGWMHFILSQKNLNFYILKIEFLKWYSVSCSSFRMWHHLRADWYNEFSIVTTVSFIAKSSRSYWLWIPLHYY